MTKISLLTLALLSVAAAVPVEEQNRDKKSFSLFSIINFPNVECVPTKVGLTDVKGTCFSSTECNSKSGTSSGNCGAGFGICCTFKIDVKTGGTVSQNLTVVENPKYPTTYKTATSETIKYTITPLTTDICQLRFDIIAMNFAIASTGVCSDKLDITSPSGLSIPSLCGKNAGQHLYSDTGRSATATTATITTAASATFAKTWRIVISQIECDNPSRPPNGCLQYFTSPTGTLQSFNFGNTDTNANRMIASTTFTVCFRPGIGSCGTILRVDDSTSTPNPYILDATTTSQPTQAASDCLTARITFGGFHLCGQKFNTISAATANGQVTGGFSLQVVTGTDTSPGPAGGFKMLYSQAATC